MNYEKTLKIFCTNEGSGVQSGKSSNPSPVKIIEKIEIKNFRSVRRQIIHLNDLNVIAGENNSGKSNVLKALNLFFNGETSFRKKFSFHDDYSKDELLKARGKSKTKQRISIKVYFNTDMLSVGLRSFVNGHKRSLWVERTWWSYSDQFVETKPSFFEDNATKGLKRAFSVFLSSIKYVYIPALKNEDVFSSVLQLAGETENALLNQASIDQLNGSIQVATQKLTEDFQLSSSLLAQLWLPTALSSFWSSLKIFVASPAANRAYEEGRVAKGVTSDYFIDLMNLGDGIKSLFIPVVLNWLTVNNPGAHWIWGVDEPENSLELLKTVVMHNEYVVNYSKYAQIVVSTHSPVFIFPKSYFGTSIFLAGRGDHNDDTQFHLIGSEEVAISDEDVRKSLFKKFGMTYLAHLDETKSYAESLQMKTDLLESVQQELRESNKPLLVTEGKTDKMILDAAHTALFGFPPRDFEISDYQNNDGGARQLSSFLQLHAYKLTNRKIVGLFDADAAGVAQFDGLKKHNLFRCPDLAKPHLLQHSCYPNIYGMTLVLPLDPFFNEWIDLSDSNFCYVCIEILLHAKIEESHKRYLPGQNRIFKYNPSDNAKNRFAESASSFGKEDFENFKPLFDELYRVFDIARPPFAE